MATAYKIRASFPSRELWFADSGFWLAAEEGHPRIFGTVQDIAYRLIQEDPFFRTQDPNCSVTIVPVEAVYVVYAQKVSAAKDREVAAVHEEYGEAEDLKRKLTAESARDSGFVFFLQLTLADERPEISDHWKGKSDVQSAASSGN